MVVLMAETDNINNIWRTLLHVNDATLAINVYFVLKQICAWILLFV
jgi:hypothetical protein